jgi:hypothetical protein
VAARAGATHHHAGPHLPSGPRELTVGTADPAKGARVPRCLTCGLPELTEPLLDFALLLVPGNIPAGRYRLCGPCWRYANPPAPADPLDVTEAA